MREEKSKKTLAVGSEDLAYGRTGEFGCLTASSINSLHVCFDSSWHSKKSRQPEQGTTRRVGAASTS